MDLAAVRRRCPDAVPGAAYYPQLAAQGLHYGPRFQGIERLWQGAGRGARRGERAAGAGARAAIYHLHPALLDACGQVVAAAANGHGAGRPFLPAGLEELRVHGHLGPSLWSHAWRRPENGSAASLVGEGRLIDPEGRIVVEARGLRLQLLDGEARGSGRPEPADWLYELRWEPCELPAPTGADGLAGGWLVLAHPEGGPARPWPRASPRWAAGAPWSFPARPWRPWGRDGSRSGPAWPRT